MNRAPKNKQFAKPKNFKQSLKKLLSYIKKFRVLIIISLLLSVLGTVLTLYLPNKLQDMTNIIQKGLFSQVDLNAILKVGLILTGVLVLNLILSYLQGFILAIVNQKVSYGLRKEISKKINKLPLKYLDSNNNGDILSRVTNDVDNISHNLNNSIATLVSAITLLLGSLIMMFVNNWLMALCAIASSLVGFVLMGIIMKNSQKYFVEQQQNLGKLNGNIAEVYSAHLIVKAYNGEKEVQDKFVQINNKLYKSAWKSQFLSGLMYPIMNFVGNLGYVVVCVVGASLVFKGTITFGVIVAFMLYIRYFSQPLGQLAQVMTNFQTTVAAGERVFEFLDQQELQDESHKTAKLVDVKGNVIFKNVYFGYEQDKPVIKDFSCEIKSGQKVAIVGPTGAGKTTLVNLLMRFYEVEQGDIIVDGISIKDLTRENVHDLFSMVLQDTWLFEGTIKQNIIYSKQNVKDEDVYNVCKAIGLDHFIKTLPKGYDTVLNDTTTISAGQKQLITIARAMIQNSPMLILDEATSSVDTRSEALIHKAMDELTKNRTSFVIAHRLSTIKNADLILVMRNGDIVEKGKHQDLLQQNGFYAELYNSQFETV